MLCKDASRSDLLKDLALHLETGPEEGSAKGAAQGPEEEKYTKHKNLRLEV